jgi:hypothetical protein
MGNSMIGFGNYVDAAILSNGSWITSLPLSNLQKRQLGRVARTSSTDPVASAIDLDIGLGNVVRIFAALNHNYSLGATYRLRGSNDPHFASADFDTGETFIPVWATVYSTDTLDWEADNFWTGQYKAADIAGYPWHLCILTGAPSYLRYWRFEISDAANPAGFIQLGRIFIGDAWQPDNGVDFGAAIGWEDPTTIQTSLSSSEYFDGKAPYRVAHITTHFMSTDEAYARAFEIQRRSGTWKELFFIMDVDDTLHAIRRSFPGRQRSIDPISIPYPDANETNWEIKESAP